MADPKYANLPGIDRDQPDVYETSDLPEDDQAQQQSQEDTESESIEQLKINPNEAFGAFKGKPGINASNIDFSDKVTRGPRTGYDIPRTEYELLGDGSGIKETPQQKYQRLQHETRELAEEIHQIKERLSAESSSAQEDQSPVGLAKQVEYLQQQLTDLHLDKLLGAPAEVSLADPQGALQKRLLTELEGFKGGKTASSPSKEKKEGAASEDGHVTYQLYYRPEQAKFSNNARLADVEQRLEAMEALLGPSPEKMSALTTETSNKSLLGAVALLSSKARLLEPSQLDQVEGRLVALNQRLTHIAEKKEAAEQSDKLGKVTELYQLVKKWDSMADTLPHIVERLTVLKELHEQALQFSQALTHLDTAQQQISSHLQAHGDMLKQVQSAIGENMTSIKGNCETLETRIKSLPQK